jgi:outer membrane cobalamin receptor
VFNSFSPSTGITAATDPGEQIIVTGSRIPRPDRDAVSPVTVIRGDAFKLQGATNVEELLNQLPQVNPSSIRVSMWVESGH